MPLKRLVLLHTINRTSLILPTEEKNSSTSLARTLWDNCMTKIVRASRSSGVNWTSGEGSLSFAGGESRPNRPTVPEPNLGGDLRDDPLSCLSRDRERDRRCLSLLLLRRCLSRLRLRLLRSRLRLRLCLSLLLLRFRSLSRLCLRSRERDLDRLRLSLLLLLERLLESKKKNHLKKMVLVIVG